LIRVQELYSYHNVIHT